MLPSLILKILEFIVHKTSRGKSRILFLSQRPDLLSWFYVYLLDFGLYCNLIHHLALYQVSVRTLKRIATPLPPSLTSLLTTCGSLHLAVTTCVGLSPTESVPCPAHSQKHRGSMSSMFFLFLFKLILSPLRFHHSITKKAVNSLYLASPSSIAFFATA